MLNGCGSMWPKLPRKALVLYRNFQADVDFLEL